MELIASSSGYVDWSAMWKILVIGIVSGAGLTAIYSIGLLALSVSGYVRREGGVDRRRNLVAVVFSAVCLAVVVGAAIYGVYVIFDKK